MCVQPGHMCGSQRKTAGNCSSALHLSPSRHGLDSGARLAAPSDLPVSTPTAGALQASDPQAYAASTLTVS